MKKNNKSKKSKPTNRKIIKRINNVSRYLTVLNSRVQSFGAGSQFIVISKMTGIIADTIQYFSVNDILTSKEWSKVENDYNFFKIDHIILLFHPRNLPLSSNQDPLSVNLNFKAGSVESPSLQDNTRIVFPFLTRVRILKYYVPHVCVDGIVLNAWLSRADLLQGSQNIVFSFSAPGNTSEWNVRFELGLICRSPAQPQESKVIIGGANKNHVEPHGNQVEAKILRRANSATF
jgi:hypothetical protein